MRHLYTHLIEGVSSVIAHIMIMNTLEMHIFAIQVEMLARQNVVTDRASMMLDI